MHSIFLNLLRIVLCSKIWSILENVQCARAKNVQPAVFEWNVLYKPMKSIWSHVSFKLLFRVDFLSDDLSTDVRGVLQSSTVIVLLPVSPFVVIAQPLSHVQLCDPMDCSMLGFPVFHYLPGFSQTHVRWVGDAIQLSFPLLPSSLPALNLSQHQDLFQWVVCLHQVAKILKLQLQYQPF